ncbi:glutaredoxin family protein [Candidatus Woesearchaeota archaeon]|nr:glutaredoxin family protein [Candidatus Woesearchaeota archaeon]
MKNNSLITYINFFYSDTCPHCHDEMKFFDETIKNNPNIVINYYEVSHEGNRTLLEKFAKMYNTSTNGVPRTFIGNEVFIGFDFGEGPLTYHDVYKANIGYSNQILRAINEITDSCTLEQTPTEKNNIWIIIFAIPAYLLSFLIFKKQLNKNEQLKRYWISGLVATIIISLFTIILTTPETIIAGFAQKLPFPLFTGIIALADGFNPCAFTVLFILLSLLTYTKSKKEMAGIGGVFIITSAIMYFIFIMLMIFVGSIFIEKYGSIILKILGVVITVAGVINLKDFLFFKKGVSLTISDDEKNKITSKARKIVQYLKQNTKKSMFLAFGGTIILAVGVNIVELGCTAILPTVYMSSLINTYGSSISIWHFIWTGLYALIYILPLFAILFNFIFTFKSERINENQGRILKLVAGAFMVICGLLMIIKPTLLMFG